MMPFPSLIRYCRLVTNSAPVEGQATHIFTLPNGLLEQVKDMLALFDVVSNIQCNVYERST